ncbi:MAG: L,D-transpeptidase family protein, partial [Gaiellaceae bacterium]
MRLATAVRAAPGEEARVVARLDPTTPEGTTNLVLTLDRAKDARGSLWIRVRFPGFPDNTTGWVRRRALGGGGVVSTRLVVDLGDRRATLFRSGRAVFHATVGIGTAAAPTPAGEFYVRNKLTRYRSPFYGPIAFGTSARSPTLTDWPAGGFVGIHGTNRPDLIPGAVSHGCIRLRNGDIVR